MGEAPSWYSHYALLADAAAYLAKIERFRVGELVGRGLLDRDAANDQVRVSRAIVVGWRAIAAYDPEPAGLYDSAAGGASAAERLEVLAPAAARARDRATAAPHDRELRDFATLTDALLWWETARPSARCLLDTTLTLRVRAAGRARPATFVLGEAA